MSDPTWIGVGIGDSVGTATIDTAGQFTIIAHGLVNGQPVRLDTLTGGAAAAFDEDTTYYVVNAAADTFDLVSIPGDTVITLGSSGGADVHTAVPHYSAPELRRADAGLIFGGTADAFGARQGVRPGHTPVSVSGTTWTVEHLTGVVYPSLASTDGPYRVQHESESGSLDPADGTNDRIDALDLQIQDDDEDASGFRRARVVYIVGTPAATPAAPPVTTNSLRLATILVPSGGTPSPSVSTLAVWTVASGGVLPVRDDTEGPSAGLYEGMTRYRQDADALEVWDGSAWATLGLADQPAIRLFLGQDATKAAAESVFGTMTIDFAYPDVDAWAAGINSAVKQIPRDGVYRVSATARVSGIAGARPQVTLRKNVTSADPTTGELIKTVVLRTPEGTGTAEEYSLVCDTLHPFSAGDNIVAGFTHNSGSNFSLSGATSGASTDFIVEWVRPL